MSGKFSVPLPHPDVHTEFRLIRLPSILVKFSDWTKSALSPVVNVHFPVQIFPNSDPSRRLTYVQFFLLRMISGKSDRGTLCLCAPSQRAQQAADDSASVNVCQISESDKIQGPLRQRLIRNRLFVVADKL